MEGSNKGDTKGTGMEEVVMEGKLPYMAMWCFHHGRFAFIHSVYFF